jgi:A/G-specific adenine glycosylase
MKAYYSGNPNVECRNPKEIRTSNFEIPSIFVLRYSDLFTINLMRRRDAIESFVDHIWSWYAINKRVLPWRDLWDLPETDRAYRILVSEVMLQQTQVDRVKIVFNNFLEQFKKIEDLSAATNRDVLMAWRGMGYNSRALRLRDAARTIVTGCSLARSSIQKKMSNKQRANELTQIRFPTTMEELTAIPGIGKYTAAAIRNFAFNIPTPCLDTNIRRVLHRAFVGKENSDGTWRKDDGYLLKLAGEVLSCAILPSPPAPLPQREPSPPAPLPQREPSPPAPLPKGRGGPHDAANWHSALMDYGSLVEKGTSGKIKRATEPGRTVDGKFIPNRIFRGRIIEELRDAQQGIDFVTLGQRICSDWNQKAHRTWLEGVITKLQTDELIEERRKKYVLKA